MIGIASHYHVQAIFVLKKKKSIVHSDMILLVIARCGGKLLVSIQHINLIRQKKKKMEVWTV